MLRLWGDPFGRSMRKFEFSPESSACLHHARLGWGFHGFCVGLLWVRCRSGLQLNGGGCTEGNGGTLRGCYELTEAWLKSVSEGVHEASSQRLT
jgi:hypothetical protein